MNAYLTLPLWCLDENLETLIDLTSRAKAAGIKGFELQGGARRDLCTGDPDWCKRYLKPACILKQHCDVIGADAILQVGNFSKYPLVAQELQNWTDLFYPATPPRALGTPLTTATTSERVISRPITIHPLFRRRRYVISASSSIPESNARLRIINTALPDSKLLDIPLTPVLMAYPVIIPSWINSITIQLINESGMVTNYRLTPLVESAPPAGSFLPSSSPACYKYFGERKPDPDGELYPYSSPCASADFTQPETIIEYGNHLRNINDYLCSENTNFECIDVSSEEQRMLSANPHSRAAFKSCGEEWAAPIRSTADVFRDVSCFIEAGIWQRQGYHACNTGHGDGFNSMLAPLQPNADGIILKLFGEPQHFTLENYAWCAAGGFRIRQVINLTGNHDEQRDAQIRLYHQLPGHMRATHAGFLFYTETLDEANLVISEMPTFLQRVAQ